MKTVVFQSYRTHNVASWIERCMETVQNWATHIEADYRFFDDEIFDIVPEWYFKKAQGSVTIITDLARLMLAKRFLSEGYERAIWVDADYVIFSPDSFEIPSTAPYLFCREFWLHFYQDELRVDQKVNNAVSIFQGDTDFLDHYIETCLTVIDQANPPFKGDEVGTQYLSAIQKIINFPVMHHVGLFSPVLMRDIAMGADKLAPHYMARMAAPLSGGNLCASLGSTLTDDIELTDDLFHQVLDQLINSKGEVVNRWADPKMLQRLIEKFSMTDQHEAAISLAKACIQHQKENGEFLTLLAFVYLKKKDFQKAFETCTQCLKDDPFNERSLKLNEYFLNSASGPNCKDTFSRIYDDNQWGESSKQIFFSGPGSINQNIEPYCTFVSDFIKKNSIKSIIDLGCGDFNVAQHIDKEAAQYIGLDIVEDLIKRNNDTFANDQIHFITTDILEDDLPAGDLCLIRQVLQHLSFKNIQTILEKTKQYKYVLITDGQAPIQAKLRHNIDKQTDKHTRAVLFNNGLWLELAPFNLNVKTVLNYAIKNGTPEGEKLRTVLLTHMKPS